MDFMRVYERPDLKKVAEESYDNVVAVFAQEDVWDVHVFVLCKEGETYEVAMEDVHKETRTSTPSKSSYEEAIQGFPNDGASERTLQEALDLIVGGNAWTFQTPEFTTLMTVAEEEDKLARMSKYARKKAAQG